MEISRITSKYQATVPADVRAALGLGAGDRISWDIEEDGAKVRRAASLPDDADWKGAVLIDSKVFGEWLNPEDDELVRGL
jgi:antitoxin PrlF